MRKLIYGLLTEDAGLMALLPGGISGDRAGGVPDTLPFGVLRYEGPNPGMGKHLQMRASLWVHSEPTDYTAIDEILVATRDLLLSSFPTSSDGVWLSMVEWLGDSGDLYDSDRGTNTKYSTFLLNGSGL